MRTELENVALRRRRILFAPIGAFGLGCIWVYVRFTLGKDHASRTVSDILDL